MNAGNIITIITVVFIAGGTLAVIKYQIKTILDRLKDLKTEDDLLWTAINKSRDDIKENSKQNEFIKGKLNHN